MKVSSGIFVPEEIELTEEQIREHLTRLLAKELEQKIKIDKELGCIGGMFGTHYTTMIDIKEI